MRSPTAIASNAAPFGRFTSYATIQWQMLMKSITLHAFLWVGLCCSAAAMAEALPFQCPAELTATQQQASETPAGFTAAQETARHVFDSFRINEGPVEVRAGAIYDSIKTQTDADGTITERLVWSLPAKAGRVAVCGYSFTSVVLIRSLEGYRECTALSRKVKGGAFELLNAECH